MWGSILLFIGIIVFLVGYWFLPLSYGEKECSPIPDGQSLHWNGGLAAIVIGLILIITGAIMNLMQKPKTTSY